MVVHKKMIPEDIINEYRLQKLFSNGSILVKIRKTIYGLPQAGRLSYKDISPYLQ